MKASGRLAGVDRPERNCAGRPVSSGDPAVDSARLLVCSVRCEVLHVSVLYVEHLIKEDVLDEALRDEEIQLRQRVAERVDLVPILLKFIRRAVDKCLVRKGR